MSDIFLSGPSDELTNLICPLFGFLKPKKRLIKEVFPDTETLFKLLYSVTSICSIFVDSSKISSRK